MDDAGPIIACRDQRISNELLSTFSAFVSDRMGLCFPKERQRDLERGIRAAAEEFGFEDIESCMQWLMSSRVAHAQIEILASHLTIGETYFFRDKRSFDVLGEQVLPELVRRRRGKGQRLRVWSAGCATGEEAYSLGILLDKTLPVSEDWSVSILATDINPKFLAKASEGMYGEWSFRDAPQWVKQRYFSKTKRGYEVLPRIKKMITFSYHNLAEDPYPSLINNTNAMDIILCRNVMMYFSRERANEVVQNLRRCLVDDGWLVISPVEASNFLFSLFDIINVPGASVYRKAEARDERRRTKDKWETEKGQGGEIIPTLPAPPLPTATALVPDSQVHTPPTSLSPHPLTSQLPDIQTSDPCLEARAFADQGKLSDALEYCESAMNADRLNPPLYFLQANILQEMGRFEEAVAALRRALYLDKNFVLAHFALGHLMRRQEKYRESEKSFANACTLLDQYGLDDILPESEGISAGRLKEIIKNTRTL